MAFHSASGEEAAAGFVVDDAGALGHLQQHEVERRHRALAHEVLGQVGQRLVDELGLGAHRGQRRRIGALEQVLAQRQADHELEHHADVVASVGGGEPRAAAVDQPFHHLADVVRTGAQLGLDGGVLLVAQSVAVDDRLHQLGPSAEVVVEGRGVALAGELVDVAQRHVETLTGEQVQRGAEQLVRGCLSLSGAARASTWAIAV